MASSPATSASANEFCEPGTPSYPKWTVLDLMAWKVWPDRWGGGRNHLLAYKDAWVSYNRLRIAASAQNAGVSVELLAGVAWQEAGGDPDFSDTPKLLIREFDWSGPDWVDDHLTVTSPPAKTSFGVISMQLRSAAHELGLNADKISASRRSQLAECLETDTFNIEIVARHLRGLVQFDFPSADARRPTDEQFAIAGSRYNRGTQRRLADYQASLSAQQGSPGREYTEYGRAMLRRRVHVKQLLDGAP